MRSRAICSKRSIAPNWPTTSGSRHWRAAPTTSANGARGLDAFDVPNGVVTDLEGLLADPYLGDAGFFRPVEHPSGGKMLTTPSR